MAHKRASRSMAGRVAVVVVGAFLVRSHGKSALGLMGCAIAMVVASTFVAPRRDQRSAD